MRRKGSLRLCILLAGIASVISFGGPYSWPADSPVIVRQEKRITPTYLPGAPERNPMFYFGRAYQGAKGPVYPYPFLDVLTDERVDKPYAALILENKYVRYCVLPEVGGRIS